ncbi:metallophosphoesterase family protein [Sulfitobacter sp. W074]|uniref:metallophosphoesterase family protein n=1 Tax=Sulfitobacter sp. W074 TaxID=2867026 RepID=UPI0021A263C2|nr:metallophosphoesterase family protein [Sulfitobacter sp. W074]UWR39598.1 serine/threonine protein phosphatase [Sulfitobacter sp. W074]
MGDIHGCAAQLGPLFKRLNEAAHGNETCVFLGDYVDRGPQSREVLLVLHELSQSRPDRVICLMGNHERMLLDFIEDPAGVGGEWLRNGGVATLASFGIDVPENAIQSGATIDLANELQHALPRGLHDWLRQLPKHWSTGNMHCVHAAMSPKRPPEDQRSTVLLWGHPDFLTKPRSDGNIVVHGHTVVRRAKLMGDRIGVDTGAHLTGRLTAAHILPGECRFIEARA